MYSTYNEGKFFDAERFIRTLKNSCYFKKCLFWCVRWYWRYIGDIVLWTYLINDFSGEEITGSFNKK